MKVRKVIPVLTVISVILLAGCEKIESPAAPTQPPGRPAYIIMEYDSLSGPNVNDVIADSAHLGEGKIMWVVRPKGDYFFCYSEHLATANHLGLFVTNDKWRSYTAIKMGEKDPKLFWVVFQKQ
ncbi:MAG: hypothetical protein WC456_01780 [Patescibacteria group bacterium]